MGDLEWKRDKSLYLQSKDQFHSPLPLGGFYKESTNIHMNWYRLVHVNHDWGQVEMAFELPPNL